MILWEEDSFEKRDTSELGINVGRGTLREERKRALFNEPCAILRFSECLPGASTIEVEGGLDIGLRVRGQHVSTGGLEGFWDWRGGLTDEISNGVREE